MKISAIEVKKLRALTNAGMMDCKKALVESQGDFQKAILVLKESGQSKADSKSGRVAAHGIVSIEIEKAQRLALVLEINCETDFAAKDNQFVEFSNQISNLLVNEKIENIDQLMDCSISKFERVEDFRKSVVAKLGENITIRRFVRIFYQGTLGSYVHGNKIAALVDVDIDDKNLAKDLAMHVAASKPKYIVQTDIPKAIIDEESRILRSQAEQEGKPKEIIEKIVTGKLNKHLNEITLLGQEYIKDPDLNISQLLKKSNATVNLFVRYEVGEGIEHQDKNFADEVKEQVEASK
ncbi:MAG TPA: translation elongation factor Ts [Gammaproteobacteria bacterium]|jgi:elongation factor Ts|nr:translation elongation factor Ts [Gammaproteobacteria bacterium]HJP43213.1 translation elongation factor Ts [Gammaproteobacteria bacterium]